MTQYSAKLDKEDVIKLRVMYPGFSISKAIKCLLVDLDKTKEANISYNEILKIFQAKLNSYTDKLELRLKKAVGEF